MIWLSVRVMSTRLELFNAMFAAIKVPIPRMPAHCLCRVSLCLALLLLVSMSGSKKTADQPIWLTVMVRGNLNPYRAMLSLMLRLRALFRPR